MEDDDLLRHCKTGGRLRNGAPQKLKGHVYASAHKMNHNLSSYSEIPTKMGSNFEEDQCTLYLVENHKRRAETSQTMPKKLESAKASPSIIAKLMGLKELPSDKGHKKANIKSGELFHKTSLSGLLNNRNVEFKDVFEVIEEKNRQQDKRQSMKDLMNVKEFEADFENYRNSFVKNIDKFNPLFAKHLLDLKCYPPHLHKGMALKFKSGYPNKHALANNPKFRKPDQKDYCGHHDHIVVLDPKMGNVDQDPRFQRTIHQNFFENLQNRRDKMWRFETSGYQGDEHSNINILKLQKLRRFDSDLNEGTKSLAEVLAKPDKEGFEKNFKEFDTSKYHRKNVKGKFAREGYCEKMEGCLTKLPQDVSPIGGKSSLLERDDAVKLRARKHKLNKNFTVGESYSSRHDLRGENRNDFETEEKMLFTVDEVQNAGPMTKIFAKGAKRHENEKTASIEEKEEWFPGKHFDRKTSSSDAEIASPISVLEEIPIETESSTSSFLKPDPDFHETDTQISEELKVCMSSDDDSQGTTRNNKTSTLNLLRDQEEREFSYLLDMLIQSGVHRICPGRHKRKYHSREFPVDARLFDQLEGRYGQMLSWSKCDRRLLFDAVNSALAVVLAPFVDPHPWVRSERHVGPVWGPAGLVERVWLVLGREREKNMRGDVEGKVIDWNLFEKLGDEVDVTGKQIERMLTNELIEEIVIGLYESN